MGVQYRQASRNISCKKRALCQCRTAYWQPYMQPRLENDMLLIMMKKLYAADDDDEDDDG